MNLVASQETRRIMDRIIGFKLSYLLQKKIKSRSAGRVQSVTLKFIVDRENDIKNFIPEEYWTISGTFGSEKIKATLDSFNGKSIKVQTEDEANNIINNLPDLFKVASLVTEEKSHEPKPAFTTSTMQQEAFNHFKYSTKKTALLAQRLYEGVEIDGSPVGLITYMRTDSTRLSPEFIASAKSYINDKYGEKYCGHVHTGKSNKNIQDAHEAIRPTDLSLTPEYVKQFLHKDEYNLYALIYSRALASLMAARIEDVTTLKLDGNGYIFKAEATQQKFDGYSKIYGKFESSTKASELPAYQTGDSIAKIEINKEQHFTKAPARYTEAKIVKLMEEKGIGRPSTYSSTISTLSARKYVDIEKGVLTFSDDISFNVQILGFFNEEAKKWSWAWDNENIGFDESLIEAAKEIHEIGLKYEIGQFTTPEFETTFDDCHIWAMVATSILKMDGYYGVNMEGLDIFVAIKSDLIVENNSVLKFRDTFYTFQKNFEIFPKIAFESYTKLKGYPFKQKEEFAVAKLGESRIIASFTERGNVTHIQMLLEDEWFYESGISWWNRIYKRIIS